MTVKANDFLLILHIAEPDRAKPHLGDPVPSKLELENAGEQSPLTLETRQTSNIQPLSLGSYCTVGRVVGDFYFSAAAFEGLDKVVNLTFEPMAFMVALSIVLVAYHYRKLQPRYEDEDDDD
jgi:hypothetical protein